MNEEGKWYILPDGQKVYSYNRPEFYWKDGKLCAKVKMRLENPRGVVAITGIKPIEKENK